MRVALYVHCFYPNHIHGTEAYTLALAKALRALGHDAIVVTTTMQGEPRQTSFVGRHEWEGVPVWSFDKNDEPYRNVADTYYHAEMRAHHERLLRELKPDVVHVTHLFSHTAALLDATRALDIPTYATLTDFFGFCSNSILQAADGGLCAGPNASRSNCIACYIRDGSRLPGAGRRIRTANLPLLRPAIATVLAATARTRARAPRGFGFDPAHLIDRPEILRAAYGTYRGAIAPTRFLRDAYEANMAPLPLRLSHFGVDIDRQPKPARPPDSPKRIAFIGQIARHKGVHLLIDALRAVGSPRLTVEIWGALEQTPAYAAELQRKASGLPVRFRGTFPAADAAGVLSEIDLLAIPSTWYENSPLVLLQALATHTPAIVADVAGMTEFVEHGVNGLHFERGNVQSLAAQLREVADDPGLVARLSQTTNFTRTTRDMAEDILDMYQAAPVVAAR